MDFSALGTSLDNVVDYEIHSMEGLSSQQLEAKCAQLLITALQHTRDYIWQRDRFNLSVGPSPWHLAAQSRRQPAPTRPYMWGSVSFGDNIEDEWFIAWLLTRFSQRDDTLAVRVWDNDGEFLLIEAALHLPKWLRPEVAGGRVWLHAGRVHVLPLPSKSLPIHPAQPTVVESLRMLQSASVHTFAGTGIQDQIEARLAGYPEKAQASIHCACCIVPAKLAHVLSTAPQLVAPAVEAFYSRTPADVRAARRAQHLPPQDMVSIVVRFSRCLFAQLAQQSFEAPKAFSPLPPSSSQQHRPAQLGMMLTCAFEMLAASPTLQHTSTPQESTQDPQSSAGESLTGCRSGDAPKAWGSFQSSLHRNGYFGSDIPGSIRHKQRMAAARASFDSMAATDRSPQNVPAAAQLHDLLAQPFDRDQAVQEMQGKEGDEGWMAEGANDLEAQLQEREKEMHLGSHPSQPPVPETDAADMAGRIKAFMAHMSSVDGAETPAGQHGPDDAVSMEQQRFWSELGSALGFQGNDQSHVQADSDEGSSFYDGASGSDTSGDDDNDGIVNKLAYGSGANTAASLPFSTSITHHSHDPGRSAAPGNRPGGHTSPGSSREASQDLHLEVTDEDLQEASRHAGPSASLNSKLIRSGGHELGNDAAAQWQNGQSTSVSDGSAEDCGDRGDASTASDSDDDDFSDQYASIMRDELQGSSMARSFLPLDVEGLDGDDDQQSVQQLGARDKNTSLSAPGKESFDLQPVDVDLNLVQSLLASYGAQEGLPGPAGNLAGMLGLPLQKSAQRTSETRR